MHSRGLRVAASVGASVGSFVGAVGCFVGALGSFVTNELQVRLSIIGHVLGSALGSVGLVLRGALDLVPLCFALLVGFGEGMKRRPPRAGCAGTVERSARLGLGVFFYIGEVRGCLLVSPGFLCRV